MWALSRGYGNSTTEFSRRTANARHGALPAGPPGITTTTIPALNQQNSPGPHSESTTTSVAEGNASGANARAAAMASSHGGRSIRPHSTLTEGVAVGFVTTAVAAGDVVGLGLGGIGGTPQPADRRTAMTTARTALMAVTVRPRPG